jgi:MFS family permease
LKLLFCRCLGPLLITQTLGAINDNLFKNALVVLVLFRVSDGGAALVAAAGGVFILPYVVLSATAGQIADRFEKRRTIIWVKWAEVGLMGLAALGFLLGSVGLLFAVLFGLGVQATFFGPLKYAVLPSHLPANEIVAGNGLVEAGTFLGILIGTIAGGALFALPDGPAIVAAAGLAIALAGVAAACAIPPAPSSAVGLHVGWNLWRETTALLRAARANRLLWRCLLGLSWFWVVGATLLTELPTLVRNDLGADAHVVTLMLAFFSVGVGVGSVLCARLLKGEVTSRYVPLAAIGLAVFIWDFAHSVSLARGIAPPLADISAVLASPAGWRMLADLFVLSACGGLYSVPLYAIVQENAAADERARMIGANNVLNALAMVAAAIVTAVLALAGVSPVSILMVAAIGNLPVAFAMKRGAFRPGGHSRMSESP